MNSVRFDLILSWEQFLERWEAAQTAEEAIGLLHAVPEVLGQIYGANRSFDEYHEARTQAYAFLVDSIEKYGSRQGVTGEKVAEKAIMILTGTLLKEYNLVFTPPEGKTLLSLIKLFGKREAHYNADPCRRNVGGFLSNMYTAAKHGLGKWEYTQYIDLLQENLQAIVQALVAGRFYDLLINQHVVEAIPMLQEICRCEARTIERAVSLGPTREAAMALIELQAWEDLPFSL